MMIRITSSVPAPMYTSTPFSQPSHQSKRSAPATSATTVQITSATPPSRTNGVRADRPRVTSSSVGPGGSEGSGVAAARSVRVSSVTGRWVPSTRSGKLRPVEPEDETDDPGLRPTAVGNEIEVDVSTETGVD
jgi:hypothetical protein